jgi:hypothetical protein
MSKDKETRRRRGFEETSNQGNSSVKEDRVIADYGILDFADDFFPDEAYNARVRRPHVPPELFG